jgi:hypothetical protein
MFKVGAKTIATIVVSECVGGDYDDVYSPFRTFILLTSDAFAISAK